MSKKSVWIVTVLLAALLIAPGAVAQEPSPADLVQSYYAALEEAAASGDTTALLDLFADDATVSVAALAPQPVQGKEAIQSVLGSIVNMLQGLEVTLGEVSTSEDTVTVEYTMQVQGMEGDLPAIDTFVVQDGLIQSLTIEIAPEALGAATTTPPATLPATGGPAGVLLPGLVILGGVALAAVGRRLSR
jgi:ketosteroid isomerase-like protein